MAEVFSHLYLIKKIKNSSDQYFKKKVKFIKDN